MSYFFYRRSPRIIKEQTREPVELVRPPSVPQTPSLNLISIMVPIMVTVAGATAMMAFYNSRGNNQFVIIQMVSLCTMVASYFIPVLVHIQQKSKHRKDLKRRTQKYEAHLEEQREKLQNWKNELVLDWHQTHLEPQFCTQLMLERSSSIWERIPQDADFMKIRVGIGTVPSGFEINVPKQEGLDKDPLVEKAEELAERFATITNVPALMDMNKYRVIGLVGEEEDLNMFCRSVITQISTHHAPDEVKITAFLNQLQAPNWSWLRWLPHTWDDNRSKRYIFQERSYQPQLLEQLFSILQRRSWSEKKGEALPFYVCFISYIEMLEHEPLLPLLLKQSDDIGACTVVLASRRDLLPKECQLVVELKGTEGIMRSTNVTGGSSDNTYAKPKDAVPYVQPFQSDSMTLFQVDSYARGIAPYRIKSNSADEIVNVLTLFELFEVDVVHEIDVSSKWEQNRYPNTLPFPVGVRGGKKSVILNLHDKIERKGHGPHGLMAGTTGSGKSEVIQSMIASLAVHYHPHDVALMLIDYKGGGMSNTFADLPHVIATITNLEEEGLIERSKVSLKAELKRRQRLFVSAGNVQHIDEYYRTEWREREPLPHLFIVIDEFAQLKKDQPEFMSELVSIAAIGRTLGVHLLLATQKPGGVVDDKIWSNSRYRICLRVQDEGDSREMLKIPDAAYITNPGRGYLQVGSNEVFESVQFAWSGAPYRPGQDAKQSDTQLFEIKLDGSRSKLVDPLEIIPQVRAEERGIELKQLSVLTQYIAEEAEGQGIHRLPGPWLPPLPAELVLDDLPDAEVETRTLLNPKVGLVDDVGNQTQFPLHIDLESGHWIIYGMPGTGKTTFIQTFLYALALGNTPEDVHVYALDFGRMLKDYHLLPHVGDVIQDDQEEKIERLLGMLEEQIKYRKVLFAETGVKSRLAYCEDTGEKLPAILVVIDGYLSFKNQFEKAHERIEVIMREGASLGIYFTITVNRVSDIADRVRSNFPNAISFQLSDAGDYHYTVGRLSSIPGQLPEGRGFVKGALPPFEFHTALSVEASSESARAKKLREIFQTLDDGWKGYKPSPVRTLPEMISLQEFWGRSSEYSSEQFPIALRVDDLKPFVWNLVDGPFFTIAGRAEGGKTSLLTTIGIMASQYRNSEELELYLCDFRRSSPGVSALKSLAHTRGYASDDRSLEEMLQTIRNEVEKRVSDTASAEGKPTLMLLMDDADITAKRISGSFAVTEHLEYLTRYGQESGLVIVIAGQASDLHQNWDSWMKEIKSSQVGWLLGTTDISDAQLFNIKIPYEQSNKILPAGEGYYIRRKIERIKAVHSFGHGINLLENQIEEVNKSWENSLV